MPSPNAQAFLGAFRAKYGHEPGSLTAQGYDGARLLFDAMARAKSTSAEAIKDALAATRDYAGATGTITIDGNHDAIKPVVVVTVRDKKFAYVTQVQTHPSTP
jgi:branched-chain amino acid transport system substrate-binding protein